MAKKVVYFRIGSDNAGTVTLASLVSKNQSLFAQHGVFCPFRNAIGLIDHLVKANELTSIDLFDAKTWRQLNPEAKELLAEMIEAPVWEQYPKIVLTTETVWGRLSKQPLNSELTRDHILQLFKKLQDFFPGYEFKVILHLRRADRYCESLWNQHIKGGGKLTLDQYKPRMKKKNWPANSLILINLIEEAFGRENILIKPFERGQMHNGDLISDFLHTIELDIDEDELIRSTGNESLHTALLHVLHEVNNAQGKIVDNKNLLSLSTFIKQECDIPESKLRLDNQSRAEILEDYAAFYDTLSARYNDNKPLFLEPIPKIEAPHKELDETDRQLVRSLLFSVAEHGFSNDRLRTLMADFSDDRGSQQQA